MRHVLTLLLLLYLPHAYSATAPAKPSPGSLASPACNRMSAVPTNPPQAMVSEQHASATPMRMGQYITLQLPEVLFNTYFANRENAPQTTPVLYLNGYPIHGLKSVRAGCHDISFLLSRTGESRDIWGNVIAKLNRVDNIPVGIGSTQHGFIKDIGTAELELVRKTWTGWWWVGILALTLGMMWMGIKSGLLRDLPNRLLEGESRRAIPANLRPYSLARVQMAFWFLLATGAYTHIWLRTGDVSGTLPDSILALIGISAGTTVLSALIDSNAQARQQDQTQGLLKDILSDNDGISFHRFQMLVWTLVMGVIFTTQVYSSLIMPDFDTQMLGLMGISSGAYLGFKIPAGASGAGNTTLSKSV